MVMAGTILAAGADRAEDKAAPADTMFPKTLVAPKVEIRAYPFNLRDVRLLDGPFKQAMERDLNYMLSLEGDRLLHMFRVTAASPPRPNRTAAGKGRTWSCAAIRPATSFRPRP
jgi:hypothetical protein